MATIRHVETTVDSQGKSREVEVFVFHNPSKRSAKGKPEKKEPKRETKEPPLPKTMKVPSLKKLQSEVYTLDLEHARKEVRSFGISHFQGRTKIEAQLAQLQSLGAEIPNNWERKMLRKKRNEEFRRSRQDLKAGIKTKKKTDPSKSVQKSQADRKKKKKEKEDVFFDGKVGKYKDGVQYISAADIKRVRSSAAKGKR